MTILIYGKFMTSLYKHFLLFTDIITGTCTCHLYSTCTCTCTMYMYSCIYHFYSTCTCTICSSSTSSL